jgi:NAD(P)-dependent dehydrogenase (short-subunit alcohol dehydrogenase family)
MLKQGSGSIINNASMGGLIGFENASVYIASKHAVVGMTKTASIDRDAVSSSWHLAVGRGATAVRHGHAGRPLGLGRRDHRFMGPCCSP